MQPLFWLIVAIVIISAVVGVIAQFLNKLNEANAPPARRAAGGAAKQTDRDMDRFLAEIDRLRKKNADAAQQQQGGETAARPPVAKPVARPVEKQPEKQRPRVVAELAEPQPRQNRRDKKDAQGFTVPLPPPPPVAAVSPPVARPQDLPVAAVVAPTALAEIPGMVGMVGMIRVAALPQRARPTPKTNLARDITNLLNSGNGAATAIVLMEILGPPKCKQRSGLPMHGSDVPPTMPR